MKFFFQGRKTLGFTFRKSFYWNFSPVRYYICYRIFIYRKIFAFISTHFFFSIFFNLFFRFILLLLNSLCHRQICKFYCFFFLIQQFSYLYFQCFYLWCGTIASKLYFGCSFINNIDCFIRKKSVINISN